MDFLISNISFSNSNRLGDNLFYFGNLCILDEEFVGFYEGYLMDRDTKDFFTYIIKGLEWTNVEGAYYIISFNLQSNRL